MTGSLGRRRLVAALQHSAVGLVLCSFLFPLAWMVLASLKNQAQNLHIPPLWVFSPTLHNYRAVFAENPFAQYFMNSVIVGLASTVLGLLVGLPAAYSIARFRQKRLAMGILVVRMIPTIGVLIPWFVMFRAMGLVGTHGALVLSHLTVTLPFIVWIMIGFFEEVSLDLLEAAEIDGCTIYGAFARIAVPIVAPGVVAASIIAFSYSWNNFLLSLILGGLKTRTLPVAVYNFMSYGAVEWGGIMAGATVVVLPVLVMIFGVQRFIMTGLAAGGVKG